MSRSRGRDNAEKMRIFIRLTEIVNVYYTRLELEDS